MLNQIMNTMGSWLLQIGGKVFPLFKDEFFAPFLAGSIGIFSIFILVRFILQRFFPVCIQLNACLKRLKEFASWEDFTKNFDNFRSFMDQRKIFKHAWGEFCKTIIPPNDNEARPIWITVRPSTYFNTSDLEHYLGLRSFQAWSNILVGMGLLLTFFGLVAALFFASQAISSAVGKETMLAIKGAVNAQRATQP
ncbi:MAG: hypothetical protein ACP5SH_08855, partial [Syntrophobacteraceae bacterium]